MVLRSVTTLLLFILLTLLAACGSAAPGAPEAIPTVTGLPAQAPGENIQPQPAVTQPPAPANGEAYPAPTLPATPIMTEGYPPQPVVPTPENYPAP